MRSTDLKLLPSVSLTDPKCRHSLVVGKTKQRNCVLVCKTLILSLGARCVEMISGFGLQLCQRFLKPGTGLIYINLDLHGWLWSPTESHSWIRINFHPSFNCKHDIHYNKPKYCIATGDYLFIFYFFIFYYYFLHSFRVRLGSNKSTFCLVSICTITTLQNVTFWDLLINRVELNRVSLLTLTHMRVTHGVLGNVASSQLQDHQIKH